MWHCLSPKQPRRSRPVWTGQTAPAGSPNPFVSRTPSSRCTSAAEFRIGFICSRTARSPLGTPDSTPSLPHLPSISVRSTAAKAQLGLVMRVAFSTHGGSCPG
jgi:hypothetical protein